MASGKSIYLRNAIASHVLGGASWSAPSTVYLALSNVAWASSATGTSISSSEPPGGAGYARVAVINDSTRWTTPTLGVVSNNVELTFPAASNNWGNIVSFYIVDSATNGNILYGGDLFIQKAVLAGDTPKFESGQITVSEI